MAFVEQAGEHPARRFSKEILAVLLLGEHGGGDGVLQAAPGQLRHQTPLRAEFVERVEEEVAALRPVKLLGKLARRIVDHRGLAPRFHLAKICRMAFDFPLPVSPISRM